MGCYTADPFLVWSTGAEIPRKQVRRDRKMALWVRCRLVFPCCPGPQALPPHAGCHGFAVIPVALIAQIEHQTRRTCPHLPGSKGFSKQFVQNHALLLPFRRLSRLLSKAVKSAAGNARLMVVILNSFKWGCMKAYCTSGSWRSTLRPFLRWPAPRPGRAACPAWAPAGR